MSEYICPQKNLSFTQVDSDEFFPLLFQQTLIRMKRQNMNDNQLTGSSFDDFLQEEELFEKCTAIALKRVLERQVLIDILEKVYYQ